MWMDSEFYIGYAKVGGARTTLLAESGGGGLFKIFAEDLVLKSTPKKFSSLRSGFFLCTRLSHVRTTLITFSLKRIATATSWHFELYYSKWVVFDSVARETKFAFFKLSDINNYKLSFLRTSENW